MSFSKMFVHFLNKILFRRLRYNLNRRLKNKYQYQNYDYAEMFDLNKLKLKMIIVKAEL